MGNEFRQDQNQKVNFDNKPVWKVKCEYFTNSITEKFEKTLDTFATYSPHFIKFKDELEKCQQVDLITHEGKVTKVICHLFKNGKCTSSKNSENDCHLL